MKYQDIWDGQLVAKGLRECESRYQVIKTFCQTMRQPFTVCDIGANMNYFGIRLTEDFDCKIMSFEFHQFESRETWVRKNKNIMFLKRKISLTDLELLNSCSHFNLVLALSVLHHLPGDSSEWIEQFNRLGDYVIMEFAGDDSSRTAIRKNYKIPDTSKVLGYGDSHLKKFKRPIVLL
jgi:hypothetical protein